MSAVGKLLKDSEAIAAEAELTLAAADRIEEDGADDTAPVHRTDLGNAERLVKLHRGRFLHCPAVGDLLWTGTHYQRDELDQALRLAVQTARQVLVDAARVEDRSEREALITHAKASESEARLRAMLAIARTDPRVAIRADRLDADPMLLNTPSGTVELKTGQLREHRSDDLISRCTVAPFDPNAMAPRFEQFLQEVFAGDAELIGFVQRSLGYAATGSTVEQVLLFWYGSGANGKSVLAGILQDVLGPDYTMVAAPGLLLKSRERHTTGIADLRGQRCAFSQEIVEGAALAEDLVKTLTGGDRLKARRMFRDNAEWEPTHKIILVANHRPEVKGTDHAIWRRILLVPFAVMIPESKRDRHLREKLRQEGPGILRWLVQGTRAWLERGLDPPRCVQAATEDYRTESDPLADFITEHCIVAEYASVQTGQLLRAFNAWAASEGRAELTAKELKSRLTERGVVYGRKNTVRVYEGIGLRCEDGDT